MDGATAGERSRVASSLESLAIVTHYRGDGGREQAASVRLDCFRAR